VTDDAEDRVDADGSAVDASPAETAPDDPDVPVDFGDLSLPQRAFVAAVQNPTRGLVIVGLLAFAFSFYVAFWLVFPQVAAFMSVIGAVLLGIVALVYLVSDRLSR
jgi:Flp pilus assembly protein TadB